jgi:spore germination protein GerM
VTRTGGRLLLLALVALALGATACGVPVNAAPQSLPKNQVPFHLLSPVPPATPSTTQPAAVLVPVKIYLVSGSGVSSTNRDVAYPAPLSAVLHALIAGPTGTESAQGLSTAIPSDTRVLSAVVAGGLVTVDFSSDFGEVSGSAQVLAVEQVVFTLCAELSATTGVVFEIDDQPIEVPIANGSQVPGPVYLLDFINLPSGTTG